MPDVSRRRALAYAGVVFAVLLLGGKALSARETPSQPAEAAPGGLAIEAEPAPVRKVTVHVVGAVRSPGLYRLNDGSRVDDAIRRAGGETPKAALDLVNLAAPVADGQQVVVPVRTARGLQAPGASTAGASGGPVGRVHLNSATLEELDTLPGVGPVTAQKILDYRTKKGAFGSLDELDAVPGIGPTRLEQLRELLDL